MPRFDTAANIINLAASECGLSAPSGFDPFSSADPAFIQLVNLLTSAGRELYGMHEWQSLNKIYTFTTHSADSGKYDLPVDFGYMIEQTGWNPTNLLPMGGPMTAQNWEYLVNTGLATDTIYVTFRMNQMQMWLLPQPPAEGNVITFEYVSRYWVALANTPTVPAKDQVTLATDIILFEPVLITKMLKLRFLEAKGFDTTSALSQFTNVFNGFTGKDMAAQTLNMARQRVFPYLDWRNVPETNYGLP